MNNNREIKFRIWDNRGNGFIVNSSDKSICFNLWDWANQMATCLKFPIGDYVFQQYTGLKDKNRKEIYEGDIVKTVDNHECKITIHWVEYDRGIIKWLREGFCVCQETIGSNELHHYATCHCCPCGLEVIGNMFENSELVHKVTV